MLSCLLLFLGFVFCGGVLSFGFKIEAHLGFSQFRPERVTTTMTSFLPYRCRVNRIWSGAFRAVINTFRTLGCFSPKLFFHYRYYCFLFAKENKSTANTWQKEDAGLALFGDFDCRETTPGFTNGECLQLFHVISWLFHSYINVISGPVICIYVVFVVFLFNAGRYGYFPPHPFRIKELEVPIIVFCIPVPFIHRRFRCLRVNFSV